MLFIRASSVTIDSISFMSYSIKALWFLSLIGIAFRTEIRLLTIVKVITVSIICR